MAAIFDSHRQLRAEFDGEPGSFLITLRCGLMWDKLAFNRLLSEMHNYVAARDPHSSIPTWIAEGYWYVDWFVRSWSTNPAFHHEHDESYYSDAYERLHDLAWWLFVGEPTCGGPNGFTPL